MPRRKSPPKTLQQLEAEAARLQKLIEKRRSEERDGVIERIVIAMQAYEIRPGELRDFAMATKKAYDRTDLKGRVKYRKGENTWSGFGRQPAWLKEYIDAGGSLEKIEVAQH